MLIVSVFCEYIWNLSEFFGIPLGRFAPYIFGGMIGRLPRHK
jgi:hypothetical protein